MLERTEGAKAELQSEETNTSILLPHYHHTLSPFPPEIYLSAMSDSNGTLKRARSTSPANGRSGSNTERHSGNGKKQNTGKPSSSSNESGSARSSNAARAVGSTGTMSDANDRSERDRNESGAKVDASTDAPAATQPSATGEQTATSDASAPQITIKALIVTQDASIIIGKAGAHIKEIREKAGAKVSVSDQIPGNPERILNVTGPLDAVSKVSGAVDISTTQGTMLIACVHIHTECLGLWSNREEDKR